MSPHTLPDKYNILTLFDQEIQEGVLVFLGAMPKETSLSQSTPEHWVRLLLPGLCERVLYLSEWVLLAHYMVAEKDLEGDTLESKLEAYCLILQDWEVQEFFHREYPLLFEQVRLEVRQWTVQSLALCSRLEKDFGLLCANMPGMDDPGPLMEVRFGLGDRHQDGATVALLTFLSGKKVVYKPGNRQLEKHFEEFCSWIDQSLETGFRFPVSIHREEYSWVEFVEHQGCSDETELHLFYQRMGVYLAILYTLQASDFHYENLIASGAYPVLIDLEAFFQPVFPASGSIQCQGIGGSVLNVGLLPRIFSESDEGVTDISGISNPEGSPGVLEQMVFDFDEKGHLTRSRKRGKLPAGKNRPLLNGKPTERTSAHDRDLLKGFQLAYDFLMDHAQAVKEHLEPFRSDRVRILFRNTYVYSQLIKESRHPEILHSREKAELHWKWLDLAEKESPMVRHFLNAEKKDLKNHDVPYFYCFPGERHLYHQDTILCSDFFEISGFNAVMDRLFSLSPDDRDKQSWIAATSLELGRNPRFSDGAQDWNPSNASSIESMEALLKIEHAGSFENWALSIAQALAEELISKMDLSDTEAHWLVVRPADLEGKSLEMTPASYDLFGGMPGDILLFSYLASMSQNTRIEEIAEKALTHLTDQVEAHGNRIRSLGFFAGWGGLIYMLEKLGTLKHDSRYYERAALWMDRLDLDALLQEEKVSGLLYGSSGFILGCLSLYAHTGMPQALQKAVKAADHLLGTGIQSEDGLAWKGNSRRPLAGLAHGTSGFALCFGRLWKHTGADRYLDAVREIIRYENRLFDANTCNWADLRDFVADRSDSPVYTTAWSHGAPGIGLTRLELIRIGLEDTFLMTDTERAIENCLKYGFSGNHSLCFGGFGNLELLLNGSSILSDASLREKYQGLARQMLQSGLEKGFQLSGGPYRSAGLMNGLTGIAWQCLRLARPEFVPSILSLSE